MNILIVSQYFFPENFGINDIAKSWVQNGHHVEIVTGMPNYPMGEIFDGYQKRYEDEYCGVIIHRTDSRPRHKGSLNLFLNYMSFMFKAKKTIKKRVAIKPDIVFCYMPSPVFQLTPAIYAKKIFHCPLFLFYCDQWPESLKLKGIGSGLVYYCVSKYCQSTLNKCDYILNTAPSFIDYNFSQNKVSREKMDWILQPITDMHNNDSAFSVSQPRNENEIHLLFAGNIGAAQNIQDIINAYNLLKIENLFIHIYGDGSEFCNCKALVERYNIGKNVILHGRVSFEYLQKQYKLIDACLLTLSGKTKVGNTIPSKLTGYMAEGKIVLAAINGDSRIVIDKANCGLYTEPDDYIKLAQLIKKFIDEKDKYSNYGMNGRNYYLQYGTIDAFNHKVESILKRLIEENK
ncbi:MAG: glycosyltransferase family 4 protein [Clostridia bacterium]|nr:glycosyltransferase family 4 protein [Clostridia bacterium]